MTFAINLIDYVVQPALVGAFVFGKNVLFDRYLPEDPHVWIDTVTNVVAKLLSSFVTLEFIEPLVGPHGTWVEPVLHGGFNGSVKHMFVNTDGLSALSFIRNPIQSQGRRVLPPLEHYSFENGFLEGAGYNLVSKLITMPLE